jgi:hypothetical protein
MKAQLLYIIFLIIINLEVHSQVNLTSGLTACYSLDGNGAEPINNLTAVLKTVTAAADRFGNLNKALSFAGTDSSYLALPNSPIIKSDKITTSFWVKFNSMHHQFLVFTENGCTSYYEGYQFAVGQDAMGFKFQNAVSGSNCSQIVLNSNTIPVANTWYHLVFYAGADNIKIYVNGILEGVMANPNPLAYNSLNNVYVGTSHTYLNMPFEGIFDELRFYNRELTAAEINFLYTHSVECATTVGVGEHQSGLNNLNIYPNPAKEQLVVEVSDYSDYYIINVQGQKIKNGQLGPDQKNEININDLPNGFYLLKVEDKSGTKTIKVLKED